MVAQYIIGGALILLAILMTGIILVQTGKSDGLSSAISGGSTDTFFGKSGGSTKEKLLKRATIVLSVVFVALTIVLMIMVSSAAA